MRVAWTIRPVEGGRQGWIGGYDFGRTAPMWSRRLNVSAARRNNEACMHLKKGEVVIVGPRATLAARTDQIHSLLGSLPDAN